MFSKLSVVLAALATIASASDLFTMVGMADDGLEACGDARQVSKKTFISRADRFKSETQIKGCLLPALGFLEGARDKS